MDSKDTNNFTKSRKIIKMLDHVQNALEKCQQTCHKMDGSIPLGKQGGVISAEKPPMLQGEQKVFIATTAPYARAPTQVPQDIWVVNQFEKISIEDHQNKHLILTDKEKPSVEDERGNGNESDYTISRENGLRKDLYQTKDDVRTKSGYSTEEDGTVSMNTTASISSSMAAWYPYNQFCNRKRPRSDSDNNSLVVELSDDESSKQMELPESKGEDTTCKLDTAVHADRSIENPAQSHLRRSFPKRARLSNSFRNLKEINTSISPSRKLLTHTRRGRKQKWQKQQGVPSDESTGRSNSQVRRGKKTDYTSALNGNPRSAYAKVPRLDNNYVKRTAHESTVIGFHHEHSHSGLLNSAVDPNHQDLAYKYVSPMQLPIYNNIPILTATRTSMWPVAPIYFPANSHMFLAFGQPQPQPQPHPHAHLYQYPQQPHSTQMVGSSSSVSTSTGRENVIGQSIASNPITSTQYRAPQIRPELTWLRKELICPSTEIGPDGKPIKPKVKRRPLPDWMAAAVENCDSAMIELKAARYASREQLYRTIVEEEYGFVTQD